MALLKFLGNHDSKANKLVVAVFGATVSVSLILGYADFAEKAAAIGTALGVYLVGNPKDVVVVTPENPSASA